MVVFLLYYIIYIFFKFNLKQFFKDFNMLLLLFLLMRFQQVYIYLK